MPAPESGTPTPHQMETAARELVADAAENPIEPEVPDGTPSSARRYAKRSATRWPKRCGRTTASS